jgi:uncharacterized protein YegP (UPF0339 family)
MLTCIRRAFARKPHIEVCYAREWFVRVKAANGEIMLVSETYDSKSNAQRAARNLKGLTGWAVKDG